MYALARNDNTVNESMRMCKLSEEQTVQGHGINVFAVLVNTHVAGSNFVDQHNFTIGSIAKLELDVVQFQTLFCQIVSNDLGDGLLVETTPQ